MAFTHGLGTSLLLDGHDISRFFREAGTDRSKDTAETTGFKAKAKTFIPGLKDGTASLEGMYDGGEDGGAEILERIFDAAKHTPLSVYTGGDQAGQTGKGMLILQTGLAVTTSPDDVVMCSAELQASAGIHSIRSLTGLTEKTVSGESVPQDNTVPTDNGVVAFLHVTDCDDDVDVIIQHSTDGDTWVDLAPFGIVDEPGGRQIIAPGTVNRFVRIAYTLAGSSATFQAGFGRHLPQVPN